MRNARYKKAITIVDIARQLGISAMTLSWALTVNPEVSETTRQKVLKYAGEIGYKPHRWARSLVTHRTSMVGVMIMDWPRQQLGRIAATHLIAAITHRTNRAFMVRKVCPPRLLVRQSSAPPAAQGGWPVTWNPDR
jgi:DNA-binding LacI/PurR family transcriptional regulator